MSFDTPEEVSLLVASHMPYMKRNLIKGMIPEFRSAGFFTDETDDQICDKDFSFIMAAWNMSAWVNLMVPKPIPATPPSPG